MAEDWSRLAAYVRSRRLVDLGLEQTALADLAGVSKRTIVTVENGRPVNLNTRAKLEAALGWAPGSTDAVLSGGEPSLIDSPEPAFTDPYESAIWALSDLPTSTRLSLIDHLRAERHRQTG